MIDLPDQRASREIRSELAHHARLAAFGGGMDRPRLRALADQISAAKPLATGVKLRRMTQAQELLGQILESDDDAISTNDFQVLGNLLDD